MWSRWIAFSWLRYSAYLYLYLYIVWHWSTFFPENNKLSFLTPKILAWFTDCSFINYQCNLYQNYHYKEGIKVKIKSFRSSYLESTNGFQFSSQFWKGEKYVNILKSIRSDKSDYGTLLVIFGKLVAYNGYLNKLFVYITLITLIKYSNDAYL